MSRDRFQARIGFPFTLMQVFPERYEKKLNAPVIAREFLRVRSYLNPLSRSF